MAHLISCAYSAELQANVERIIADALHEDIGEGDITSQLLLPDDLIGTYAVVAREPLVVAGIDVLMRVFQVVDSSLQVIIHAQDGQQHQAGEALAEISGPVSSILTAERTVLNLLQRMCGVATLTRRYVDAVAGTDAVILDTRKTMPGMRYLDKYACLCGVAQNHRLRLDDRILIKDNHIVAVGSITEAIQRARAGAPADMIIEVECDTLEQVKEALDASPDVILLDNMKPDMLREAVAMRGDRSVKLEASGGVTLQTIRSIADTGVDYISIGALTHSAVAVDIGLDSTT